MNRSAFCALVLVSLVPACRKAAPPAPSPPEVEVAAVIQRDVPNQNEWIGTLDGSVNADIRPRVEGYLLRQLYKEGQFVKVGAPALRDRPPRSSAPPSSRRRAPWARRRPVLAKADKDVERFTPLAAERAISQQELDDALAAQRNATAAVSSARAASGSGGAEPRLDQGHVADRRASSGSRTPRWAPWWADRPS